MAISWGKKRKNCRISQPAPYYPLARLLRRFRYSCCYWKEYIHYEIEYYCGKSSERTLLLYTVL